MAPADAILLLHAAATVFMTGVIWFVQVVHYPLFAGVGEAGYPAYQTAHMARTGRVVGPAMLAELLSGLVLAWRPPTGVPGALPWLGLALLAAVWVATALVQVPLHDRLRGGFDPAVGRRLVVSNWLRTALWSGRGVLVLAMLGYALASPGPLLPTP